MACNYEYEVQRFYDWLETNELGTSCIVLWHALMHTYRKAEYPELFTVAVSVLEIKTGLKSTTIKRARNELRQSGRIDWFERKGNQSAIYKIILFENAVVKRPQTAPQYDPQTAPQSDPQTAPIINNNNDIDNINNGVVVINKNAVVKRPQHEPQCEPQSIDILLNGFKQHSSTLKNIQQYYELHIGNLLSPTAYMKIIEFLNAGVEEALICKAMDKSIDAGARNWVYAERVINSCITKNILTLEQYEANEANRNASKARMENNKNQKLDGNNAGYTKATPKKNRFNNFTGRNNDYEELERMEQAYINDITRKDDKVHESKC